MRRHLVIGGTSGIGRAIAKELCDRDEEVSVLIRNKSKADKYYHDLPAVQIIQGDAFKSDDIENAMEGIDVVYYCINVPYHHWSRDAKSLLYTSVNAAIKKKPRFVFPGNVYVYGHAQTITVKESHPLDFHTKKGRIRVEMERMLRTAEDEEGLDYLIIRMPDFYGPYVINGFYEKLFMHSLQGKKLQWYGDLDVTIEFIFIEDAAKGMVIAALSDKPGREFNLPGANLTTPREFLSEIVNQGWKESKIKSTNSGMLIGLAGIFSPVAREFKEMMYLKQERFVLDGTLYKSTFGVLPSTPYKEGIKKTLRWAKNFYGIRT